jgi:hypothetical protein
MAKFLQQLQDEAEISQGIILDHHMVLPKRNSTIEISKFAKWQLT